MDNKKRHIEVVLEISHSKNHPSSAVPRVLLEQANYEVIDHRTLAVTPTFILEKYDSVVSPAHTQEQESEGGRNIYLLQMPFTKIPRQSPKQIILFLSGLIPLGNSPGS